MPPADVPACTLARHLCAMPRPSIALPWSFRGLAFDLRVVAPLPHEEAEFQSDPNMASLLYAVLYDGQVRAFDSPAAPHDLCQHELTPLVDAVIERMWVAPAHGRTHLEAYRARCQEGLCAPEMHSVLASMIDSMDCHNGLPVPRPERYYGVPVRETTDGQRLVLATAARISREHIANARASSPHGRR